MRLSAYALREPIRTYHHWRTIRRGPVNTIARVVTTHPGIAPSALGRRARLRSHRCFTERWRWRGLNPKVQVGWSRQSIFADHRLDG